MSDGVNTWALEFFDWSDGVVRVEACPSYSRFLQRKLGGAALVGDCRVPVATELLEETVKEQYCGAGVAAVFATSDQSSPGTFGRLLCVYDCNTEQWKLAASKNETATACPICLEPYDETDHPREGPLAHPWPTACTHWVCRPCLKKTAAYGGSRCPVCREDMCSMLAVLFPDGPQARVAKASDASVELLLSTAWSVEPAVRRGTAGTFAVQDVLRAACEGPPPDWAGLEALDPDLVHGTDYENFEDGAPCVAVASGRTLMRALRLLGDRLRSPLPRDQAPWATSTPLIVMEMEMYTFYRGEEIVSRAYAPPRRIVLFSTRDPDEEERAPIM